MKVLLVNGSPHKNGCTFTALSEIAKILNEETIGTEIYHIGNDAIAPCRACGACAKLKNGVSLCIQPQVGQNNIQGVWDLNGPKGPNIKGRDYDTFSIEPVKFSSFDLLAKATTEVTNQANPNLQPDPENPCEVGDFSTPCCT